MIGIMALLANLSQAVTATELRQLRVIVPAVLAMTGQVTMLNIVRWSGQESTEAERRRVPSGCQRRQK